MTLNPDARLCRCGCARLILRTRYPSGKLEPLADFRRRTYATASCYRAVRADAAHSSSSGARRRSKSLRHTETPLSPAQSPTALATGLGPLQLFAMRSPAPKRHDLNAERESAGERPEPSRAELLALLKVCLRLHEPFIECFEEAARAALPVPSARASRAKWQV